MLSELDCVAGDGDHGTTMLRVVERLEDAVADRASADVNTALKMPAGRFWAWTAGASSSLLGTFFAGMADAPGAVSLDCRGFADAFEAGSAGRLAGRPRLSQAIRQ